MSYSRNIVQTFWLNKDALSLCLYILLYINCAVKKFVKWYFDIEAHDGFVLALLEKNNTA